MIQFEGVTKSYPLGTVALDNVSFNIERNEFVFLVGTSGAGKTSILNLILGDLYPSSGTVIVNDVDLSPRKCRKIEELRRYIGVVFQDFKILQDKDVFENIALGLHIQQLPIRKIKEQVREVLKLVGLEEKERYFPIQLSAGELQRVAIARAMCGDRQIILADEPTGNLDPKTTWDIMKIFKKVEDHKTIVIATHNTDVVNSMKKRVIVLKQGKLIKDMKKGGYEL
ncbi:cell division ATP-binding protein FtsE [Candidatus Roizmanbacteria bacterium CG11_big_fil_rev_8_21_14_0_20_37_16]|uniref:Cell division ATP-binding protein FtsE n=1 Tax=Candidatus Roizmanbacteria bacterium CG11_big_fil_rev_8_21_14_0_20_37_16 TaxID=1974857 RepID=A0A2H0KKK8_9BACT|nr:MAG: cell division ATP-binding protein FtsE [Candidatus Roizmanbacteria bacterium CG11_big_fil_rev_8_21_14_0_20_37_16]